MKLNEGGCFRFWGEGAVVVETTGMSGYRNERVMIMVTILCKVHQQDR